MRKFGLLTGITMRYTAFSPWGQALKAEGHLSIAEHPDVDPYELHIDGASDIGLSTVSTGKKVLNGVKNIFR